MANCLAMVPILPPQLLATTRRTLATKRKKPSGVKKILKLAPIDKPEEVVMSASVQAWNEEQIYKAQNPPPKIDPHQGPVPPKFLTSTAAVVKAAIHQSKLQEPPPVRVAHDSTTLPRGTIVYHGTTLHQFQSILEDGFIRAKSTERSGYVPPPAVYSGGLFKALASAIKPALEKETGVEEEAIPIVLELELPQEVEICMDPDYFLSAKHPWMDQDTPKSLLTQLQLDHELAALSWSQFHSAGLRQDIPQSCIRNAYTPRMTMIQSNGTSTSSLASNSSLYFMAAALFLEFQKQRASGLVSFWESKFETSPLMLVERPLPEALPITSFSPQVQKSIMALYHKQFRSDPSCVRRIQEAQGDPDLLDALCLQACQERTKTKARIEQRMAVYLTSQARL